MGQKVGRTERNGEERRHNLPNTTSRSGTRKLSLSAWGACRDQRSCQNAGSLLPQHHRASSPLLDGANLSAHQVTPTQKAQGQRTACASSSPQEPPDVCPIVAGLPSSAGLSDSPKPSFSPTTTVAHAQVLGSVLVRSLQFRQRPEDREKQTRRRKELGLWSQQKGDSPLTPLMNWLCDPQQA